MLQIIFIILAAAVFAADPITWKTNGAFAITSTSSTKMTSISDSPQPGQDSGISLLYSQNSHTQNSLAEVWLGNNLNAQ